MEGKVQIPKTELKILFNKLVQEVFGYTYFFQVLKDKQHALHTKNDRRTSEISNIEALMAHKVSGFTRERKQQLQLVFKMLEGVGNEQTIESLEKYIPQNEFKKWLLFKNRLRSLFNEIVILKQQNDKLSQSNTEFMELIKNSKVPMLHLKHKNLQAYSN